MSVVPSDFEELKKYNLAEIFNPSPKGQPVETSKEQPEQTTKDADSGPAQGSVETGSGQ
jgi:tRNA acetyltransferase TAN1